MDVDPVNTPAAPANGDSEAQRDRASLSSGATSNTADVPLDAEVSGILDGSDASQSFGKPSPKSAEVPLVHYDFGRDDKVWAKLIGFPWWPCKVRAPKDEDGLVRVRFFGTGESCKVRSTSKEVRPWEGELSFVGEAIRAKLPEKKKALVAKWELALREARGEVEQGTPDSEPEQDINWSTEGHDFLNARVALAHEKPKGGKRVFLGTIVKWAPPDADAGDQALFHVRHDDGDSEDLEDYEVKAAMEMYKEQPEHIRKEAKAVKDAVRRRRRAILGAQFLAQFSARNSQRAQFSDGTLSAGRRARRPSRRRRRRRRSARRRAPRRPRRRRRPTRRRRRRRRPPRRRRRPRGRRSRAPPSSSSATKRGRRWRRRTRRRRRRT